ncbi:MULTISPECIES: tail fiber domain-containing protein [Sinorhizobium]|uniref:Peptidase S74 domain-containing protein n=1 Tax=Sinorhizobium americanum TaxID=194963 RepID=A0A2S3YVT5_9HYPH|nr:MULTISPECIES: tail fiber domain-containing protein [Sinorhizobium]PDT39810.1 hypothetical protein CO656_19295 [Sinorhizobium sp. FG01]POH35731.1 hypothetical protein ATY31_00400 [Sinorhizobium americanum]
MGLYGSAPKSPDPQETASAQTATNIGTAVANNVMGNVNQVTPDGKLTYTYTTQKWTDPLSGKVYDLQVPTATQELSAEQKAIKGQTDAAELNMATLANTQSGKLNNLLGKPIDISSAPTGGNAGAIGLPQYQQFGGGPNLQTSVGNAGDITKSFDVDFDTSRYEQALMDRLNPQLEQDRAALETRLANQGLQPGSEAYNRAIDQASRQSNDARISAILNAGQEQSRIAGLARDQASFQNAAQQQQFGQNVTSAGFGNDAKQQMYQNQNTSTAANNALKDQTFNAQQSKFNMANQQRAQYLNELYAQRNQPINEIIGLMSGAQVNSPSFVPTQSNPMPTVDYAGLVQQDYANKMGAYNQQQGNMQSLFGGLLGFGGHLASLSDKRAKKDIKKVGELKGHGLYEYAYRGKHNDGKRHIGVMAQEVEKKRPDAVFRRRDGLRQVNYGALFNAGRKK